MFEIEWLKNKISEIRKEYFDEHGFDNGVDYMANEMIDALDNELEYRTMV